jgi:hypothetical protein
MGSRSMRSERPAAGKRRVNCRLKESPHTRASVITVTGFELPQLRLIGYWLARAGFKVGTWAEVRAGTGRIVIEVRGHLSDPGAREQRAALRKAFRA